MSDFLKAVKERVVVYDGAMGTSVQGSDLGVDEYWGKEGYNEVLVLSRPDIVSKFMPNILRGAATSSRPTHSAPAVSCWLNMNAGPRARDQSGGGQTGARGGRELLDERPACGSSPGSMGPTTKLPSLGHIGFDAMVPRTKSKPRR